MEDGACGAGPPLYPGSCGSASTGRASGLGHATRAADMRRDEGRGRNTSTPCASEGVVSKAPGGEPGGRFFSGGNQEISVFGFGGQDGGGYGVGPSREGRKGLHGVFPARG